MRICLFNDQSFNDTLTNDIVSFEQLGPGVQITLTSVVTSNKICISHFEGAEARYRIRFLFWNFRGAAVW